MMQERSAPVQESHAIANGGRPRHEGEVSFEGLQVKLNCPISLILIDRVLVCRHAGVQLLVC